MWLHPLNQETYILDGYDYYFMLDSVSDGRIIINKNGPYGYGEPVTDTRGTVILDNGRLVFVADPKPASSGDGDFFDLLQASISSDEAARIACGFAWEHLDDKYWNEVAVDHIELENGQYCWQISFYLMREQLYIVCVNAETGEVEDSFTADKGMD